MLINFQLIINHTKLLMRGKNKYIPILLTLVFLLAGCSTQKNTLITRTYHNITAKYNILFNGDVSFNKGMRKIDDSFRDDYSEILPVFTYSDEELAKTISPDMDRTIKKGTKLVSLHSITVKPKLKSNKALTPKKRAFYNKKEFNRWVDDNYLLVGKSHFYKHDFNLALETFRFITNEFKNEEITYDALIWIARTYNETEAYKDSEEILTQLEKDEKLPKRLIVDFHTTFADLFLKQNNITNAITHLEKAKEKVKKKKLKTRFIFILAQLYESEGMQNKASKLYSKVIKMNPPYEMTFNAKINRALAYEKGYGSVREIEKQLSRMLKDDKNSEYQDQIYYALGNLAYKDDDIPKAIKQYKKSVQYNINNTTQKARSYLTLADIYYEMPEYVNAQAYYDSAVTLISIDYQDYDIIYAKSKSLTSLVKEINTVNFQDSVRRLAKLPNDELLSFIDKLIEDVKKKEQEEIKRRQEQALNRQFGLDMEMERKATEGGFTEGVQWYFYNQTARSLGYKEFKLKWGNRELADNWRRANKNVISFGESLSTEDTDFITDEESQSSKLLSNKTREFYLKDVPLTDSMVDVSLKLTENALYNMGLIYKNELKDYEKAIESFKELIKRYPDSEFLLPSYYYLYDIYIKENNKAMVESYKNRIVSRFPNSTYAKLLTNPNYIKELEAEQNKVHDYYIETYNKYLGRQYNNVIQQADYAIKTYPDDELIPQFAYLRALSTGRTSDVKTFKEELYEILSTYPQTEVAENAKNIIAYLDKEHPDIKEEEEKEIAIALYEHLENTEHLFALVLNKGINANQLMFNIINFNLDNFDKLNLKVESTELNNDQDIITVISLKDKAESLNYYNRISSDDSIFKDVDKEGVVKMVISRNNLDILKTDKSVNRYLKFFNEYYE
ncbi:MAG: tetratricopeptide repeat protein [Bacteroidales bacterium]|nr:MAG: tetratricopeptide repeat protein [Bacteroidales bacterium]